MQLRPSLLPNRESLEPPPILSESQARLPAQSAGSVHISSQTQHLAGLPLYCVYAISVGLSPAYSIAFFC